MNFGEHYSDASSNFLNNIKGGNIANNLKAGKYKIGFLAAWPSYGASLKVDYSDKITFEVVAAPLGTFSSYSTRVDPMVENCTYCLNLQNQKI